MTASPRIEMLQRMLQARPDDPRAHFGLALEHERQANWEQAVHHLRLYLAKSDDEGNAYGRLGRALHELGHDDEARSAYQQGIEAANRHGHPTMAAEFEEAIGEF